jgi:flagellar hook-associated protein 3 FlgL
VDENGNPDPFRNVDFEVALSDGTTFTVDLVPGDTTSVAGVLAKINADAAAAGLTIGNGPGEFQARMDPNGNGLVLEDFRGGAAPVKVTSLNGYAAADLGFLDGAATTGTPATLTGSDRTSVRVESLFTTLIDLRDSLEADDPRGITFAGERLEADLDRLNRARALVGGRAQRVEESEQRLEDKAVLDASIKSELQDLDFFEASSRLTLLQTQLQASIQVAAQSVPLSLLNFL